MNLTTVESPLRRAANHQLATPLNRTNSTLQSGLDDTMEPKPKRLKRAFKIWEDSVAGKDPESDEHAVQGFRNGLTKLSLMPFGSSPLRKPITSLPTGSTSWMAINLTLPIRTISTIGDTTVDESNLATLHSFDPTAGDPFRATFSVSEADKYPNAHAGMPTGPKQEYFDKRGVTFQAPPMEDLGPIGTQPIVPEASHEPPDPESTQSPATKRGRPTPIKVPPFPSRTTRDTTPEHPTLDFADWLRINSAKPTFGSSPTKSTILSIDIPTALRGPATTSRLHRLGLGLASPHTTAIAQRAISHSPPQAKPSNPETNTTKGKKRISLSPVCAKPIPNPDNTLSPPEALQLPQQRFPRPTQLICSCHKPANTFRTKIVECYNLGCIVGWYHYHCLGKNQKLSAVHGRWTCDLCKSKQSWGEATESTDMKFPFSADEIAEGLGGPNGIAQIANAYGMGHTTELYGGVKPRAVRARGWAIHDAEAVARAMDKLEREELEREALENVQKEEDSDVASDVEEQDYETEISSDSELETSRYWGEGHGELDEGSVELGSESEDVTSGSE